MGTSRVIDREERLANISHKLSSSGYRISSQRAEILRALISSEVHPSAEDVYLSIRKKFPRASLATVYKTFDALKSLKEIKMVSIAAGRSHYDVLDLSDHPHVICTQCGRTEDVKVAVGTQDRNAAERSSGYKITEEHLQFYGLCPNCQHI